MDHAQLVMVVFGVFALARLIRAIAEVIRAIAEVIRAIAEVIRAIAELRAGRKLRRRKLKR